MSDPLEGWISLKAENHQPDVIRGGCTCGFAVWSATHVAILAYREAVAATRPIPPGEVSQ